MYFYLLIINKKVLSNSSINNYKKYTKIFSKYRFLCNSTWYDDILVRFVYRMCTVLITHTCRVRILSKYKMIASKIRIKKFFSLRNIKFSRRMFLLSLLCEFNRNIFNFFFNKLSSKTSFLHSSKLLEV